MRTVKFFDIHDKDVTPIVYHLMFALVETRGNDLVYQDNVNPYVEMDDESFERVKESWEERIRIGKYCCYYDKMAMEEMLKNPPTVKEAVAHFIEWLKEHGVYSDPEAPDEKDGEFFVKIWW